MATSTVMKTALLLVFLASALTPPVTAHPIFYGDSVGDGCTLPTQGYGLHSKATRDKAIEYQVLEADGGDVSEYVPGSTYTIKLKFRKKSEFFILASAGQLASTDAWTSNNGVVYCDALSRLNFMSLSDEADMEWTAPARSSGPVTFSVARAEGAFSKYFTSTLTVDVGK
ncbi:uncharacterized protein LOC142358155 [Convolutriloba macropyga]|uniref:uncharacterized protein LOC142358155 n=1 Tax=Convolutriloba macropyga TaxID=536237 RepID=UPI003F522F3A